MGQLTAVKTPALGKPEMHLGYSVPFDLIGNGPASSGSVGTAPGRPCSISTQEPLLPDSIPQGWRSIRREDGAIHRTPVSHDFGAAGKGFIMLTFYPAQLEALGSWSLHH